MPVEVLTRAVKEKSYRMVGGGGGGVGVGVPLCGLVRGGVSGE